MSAIDSAPQPCLVVSNLVKKISGRKIVDGLSFAVQKGQIVGLLGPNGAGKTTAFYITIGLMRPDSGHVFFQGEQITGLPMHQRARRGLSYLAQEPSIFRGLTVKENIWCILQMLPLTAAQRRQRLEEALCELHLEKLAKKKAATLSGGERRRLEISRLLVTGPSCLLLDEPFANIDPLSIHEVKELIVLLAKKQISILITDHNAREIFSIVDHSYLICDGKVLLCGSVTELMQSELARRSYLGHNFAL